MSPSLGEEPGSSHWALAPRAGVVAKPSEGCRGGALAHVSRDELMRVLCGSTTPHLETPNRAPCSTCASKSILRIGTGSETRNRVLRSTCNVESVLKNQWGPVYSLYLL